MVLKISSIQLSALKEAAVEQFVRDTTHSLDREFGDLDALFAPQAIQSTIRYGIARSGHYGIFGKADVYSYIRLMFTLLGSDFDIDPLYPWASEILSDSYHPANDRMVRLELRAQSFLDSISEREPCYFVQVAKAIRHNPFSSLPRAIAPPAIEEHAVMVIDSYFPGKTACIGIDAVRQSVASSCGGARMFDIRDGGNVAAFALFAFLFGVQFYDDPKYPEVKEIFRDSSALESRKIAAMLAVARNYLTRKLAILRAKQETV